MAGQAPIVARGGSHSAPGEPGHGDGGPGHGHGVFRGAPSSPSSQNPRRPPPPPQSEEQAEGDGIEEEEGDGTEEDEGIEVDGYEIFDEV